MKFELTHKAGSDYNYVNFYDSDMLIKATNRIMEIFLRLGGIHICENQYKFPNFITSFVIKEIIRNTCFVCGGLMQDSELHTDHILRKCVQCGHSHT